MNNNSNSNSGNVNTYKATNNMNTFIDNPNANFNDMMNVNIQNASVNSTNSANNINSSNNNTTGVNVNNNMAGINVNNAISGNMSVSNDFSSQNIVTRTYVSSDNKPKKKTVSLNLGTEFKIALLIVVILLVFIFLLPYIGDMFKGY